MEYGFDDQQTTATTRVHIVQTGHDAGALEDDKKVDDDCRTRQELGKYYVKIAVRTEDA